MIVGRDIIIDTQSFCLRHLAHAHLRYCLVTDTSDVSKFLRVLVADFQGQEVPV